MPIVNGKYKNPGWVNNQQPPISAENLNDISDTLEKLDQGGSGGKRYASLVVGTSTAGWTAADCDYLCDGTADNVEIQAAMDAIPSGGEIVLLNGTYNLEDMVTTKQYTILRGCGRNTVLKRSTAGGGGTQQILVGLVNSDMRDLTYDGDGFPLQTGQSRYDVVLVGGHVQNCVFWNCEDIALLVDNGVEAAFVSGNYFYDGDILISTTFAANIEENIFMISTIRSHRAASTTGGPRVNISNNTGLLGGFYIALEDVASGSVIANNALVYSIEITSTAPNATSSSNGTSCVVSGNTLYATSSAQAVITLGVNTRNIFVTGNLLIKWFNNPVPTIQDNGTNNIVKWNSTDTGGVASFNGRTGAVVPASGDYTATQVGAVPTSRTVNGKALSSNISLTTGDIGITYGTSDLTAGSSSLATGNIYLVYE